MRDLPILHRHRYRWANGIGFALTLFFALWLLAFLLGLAQAGFRGVSLPLPTAFAVVGAVSLVATIALLAIVLFGYVFRGADLSEATPRYLLFAWTCAGSIFFLSQAVAMVKVGRLRFPHVPGWLSELYGYFGIVGAVIFALLLWVNSEGHHYPWEPAEDEYVHDEEEDGPGD